MAIAKNPNKLAPPAPLSTDSDTAAAAFIAKSGGPGIAASEGPAIESKKRPIMVRIPPDVLTRIDAGARRLGINRTAFLISSAVEKLERMEPSR